MNIKEDSSNNTEKPASSKQSRMRFIAVKIPAFYLKGIDDLIREGRYINRSDAIRAAIRDLLQRELWNRNSKTNK